MRVHVPAMDRYVYPDGSIVCGRPEFTDVYPALLPRWLGARGSPLDTPAKR